jgi:hypothetical protein
MKPRNIIWLNKIYGEWIKSNENLAKDDDDDDDISDSELEIESSKNSLQQKEKPNDIYGLISLKYNGLARDFGA